MTTFASDLRLTTSVWQLLQAIDSAMGQALPLAEQLEKTADILIEALDVDAIWLLTVKPLSPIACGTMRTHLTVAPNAKVRILDHAPPSAENWPGSDTLLGTVIAQRTPKFIEPDLAKANRADSDLGDALFKTFEAVPTAIVPMIADDDTPLGVLVVGSKPDTQTKLSPDIRDFLTYLGKHLARHLLNTYLVGDLRRHSDTLVTLNQIAQTITSSLDIDEVIQKTMSGINKILDVEAGSLLLLDQASNELYFKITLRGENKQVSNFRLEPGEGIAGWVVENNKPAVVNDPFGDLRFTAKIDRAIGFQTSAVLCVPLVVKGRPIGALEVLNKRQGAFDDADLALLVSMAASLGVALNNASLYNESQARAHINEVINEITASINAGHGLSETAKIVSRQFRRLFDYDHISLSLLDDSKQKIRQWTFSEHGSIAYAKQVIRLENSELAQVIEQGGGYVRRDISQPEAEASRYPDNEIVLLDNVRSTVVIPLTAQARPYGSLTVGNRREGAFGQDELHLLEHLSPQLSITIDKSLLIDQLEQRTTELQLLNRLSEMLVSTTDIGLIVETTLNMLPRVLPADVHGLVIAGEDGAYAGIAVPYGFKREKRTAQEILDTYLEISDGEEPVTLISTKCVPGNMPVSADWQPVTELSLPILTGQGARGVIYLASGTPEHFSDNVLRIFSLIVSQISAAIANAQLFQQVEQERARLAAILASITDAVLVVNRNGRIVLDNPTAREVISANQSCSGQLLVESTSLNALIELFDSAIKGGKPTGEISLLDGRTFFANLSPVTTGKSDALHWVATMHDISHFKELNQLKNDFVSSVSHDLKSPLSSILLAINLVAEAGVVTESQQELINTVDRQVRAMGQLIDDILDIGKIEAGIDMEMEPCELAPIIGAVIEAFKPQAADKPVELSIGLDDELPAVMANGMRLRQVFYNLIGNAIKYTPSQGKVRVKAYPAEAEVRIQIVDTGVGIPPSDQPHIFEKFYRVRGEFAINVKGTGLGLAISKGIVEKHHGRIWLESIFGQGSTFTVALPIYSANSS